MSCSLLTLIAAAVLVVPTSVPATEVPVDVKSARPEKEKLPTLRFLEGNRIFLQGTADAVPEPPTGGEAAAVPIDERILAFKQMHEDLLAARDTLADEQVRETKRAFLASVTEVGELEAHLDLLEQMLGEQESRLRELQEDFLGRQKTALVILVRGIGHLPDTIQMTDGYGGTFEVSLEPRQRESLVQGGVLQIYHDFVEPRRQTWELRLQGGEWTLAETAFLNFEPARDKLTFLQLDLAEARPNEGPHTVRTTAWVHEPPSSSETGLR